MMLNFKEGNKIAEDARRPYTKAANVAFYVGMGFLIIAFVANPILNGVPMRCPGWREMEEAGFTEVQTEKLREMFIGQIDFAIGMSGLVSVIIVFMVLMVLQSHAVKKALKEAGDERGRAEGRRSMTCE